MSRAERDKGKRGEREVAQLLRYYGFEAHRDGRLDADLAHNVDAVHFEVKRCERLEIPKWWRSTQADAGAAREAVLCFRQSGGNWLAVAELTFLLELLAERRERG